MLNPKLCLHFTTCPGIRVSWHCIEAVSPSLSQVRCLPLLGSPSPGLGHASTQSTKYDINREHYLKCSGTQQPRSLSEYDLEALRHVSPAHGFVLVLQSTGSLTALTVLHTMFQHLVLDLQ